MKRGMTDKELSVFKEFRTAQAIVDAKHIKDITNEDSFRVLAVGFELQRVFGSWQTPRQAAEVEEIRARWTKFRNAYAKRMQQLN